MKSQKRKIISRQKKLKRKIISRQKKSKRKITSTRQKKSKRKITSRRRNKLDGTSLGVSETLIPKNIKKFLNKSDVSNLRLTNKENSELFRGNTIVLNDDYSREYLQNEGFYEKINKMILDRKMKLTLKLQLRKKMYYGSDDYDVDDDLLNKLYVKNQHVTYLDLGDSMFKRERLIKLLSSENSKNLTSLILNGNELNDEDVKVIADSKNLINLIYLDLGYNRDISNHGAKHLVDSINLNRLTNLNLQNNVRINNEEVINLLIEKYPSVVLSKKK